MKRKPHRRHRYALRLFNALLILLLALPTELSILLPARLAAAPIETLSQSLTAENVNTESADTAAMPTLATSGSTSHSSDSVIEATNAAPLAARSGFDLARAYIDTVDLGNGERGAMISGDPINYLAPDGEWKPIDPRFTQAVDGFANQTNVMTIHTAARQAVMQVSHNGLDTRWAPHALLLADGTREVVLAKPRPTQGVEGLLSADGRIVSYPGSWTMTGMADEIVAGAGEAEHNVIFTQPPDLGSETTDDDARLLLRAYLELPPGAQLWADGAQQNSVFTTTNTIELRNYEGTTRLNLSPALVFEKHRPDQSLIATYHVKPINLRSWEITMETPLAWWLDPARQYPVVWDPMMQVLRALDVAQVYQNPMCAPYLAQRPDLVGVGRATCLVGSTIYYSPVRTLFRFNQIGNLNLPPQSQILGAVLLVAPTDGYVNYLPHGQYNPRVATRLHPIQGNWNPANVNWNNQPSVGNAFLSNSTSYQGRNDPPLKFEPPPWGTRHSGTKYLLQDGPNGIVTNWINGSTNYGLELRATEAEENGDTCSNGCEFVQIPRRSTWSKPTDRDKLFDNDFEAMDGGGFMLIIRYKGPTLENNVPYRFDIPVPKPPIFENEDFHRTRHVYTPPARPNPSSQWLVVASKNFRDEITFGGTVKQGLFGYAYWSQVGDPLAPSVQGEEVGATAVNADNLQAYAFPMAVAAESCANASCETRSNGSGNTDSSNFLLLNAASAQGRDVRIDPLAPDPNLDVYAVEASWSEELPSVTADQIGENGLTYEYNLTLPSEHIVRAFSLSLPDNVRLRIATTLNVENVHTPSANVVTHVFPPTTGIHAKTTQHPSTTEGADPILTFVPPGRGGTYGVVVELPGDKTAFDLCEDGCFSSGPDFREPKDRMLQITLHIQVCPSNTIPTGTGCAIVELPEWSQPGVLWAQVGPYRIFSPAGIGAEDGAPCGVFACSKRFKDGKEYATVITWGERTERVVIVASTWPSEEAVVDFDPTPGSSYLAASGLWALGKADDNGEVSPMFLLDDGYMRAEFAGENYGTIGSKSCVHYDRCRSIGVLSGYDQANAYERNPDFNFQVPVYRINVQQSADDSVAQHVQYRTGLRRTLQTISGRQDISFILTWQVRAEGYRGWYETPDGTGPLNVSLTPQNTIAAAPIAGLTYRHSLAWEIHYSETTGIFSELRNNDGRIYQSAELGGAWQYVDYLVMPFGQAPSGASGLAICQGFCGDIRAPTDTWSAPNRQWKMPDVLVNQLPNTVMVSSPGNLQVYSTDHPSTIGSTNETIGLSFKTFGAKVELTEGACPGSPSSEPVSLIKGTTSISLPGLDSKANPQQNTSAIPNITASFTLCENALRDVSLTFTYPPGIPVAAPPVMNVDMIGGQVTIGPQNVVITLKVGFFIGTATPQLMKGTADLTLDTRGLFALQVQARVMGAADADGRLWVAWNPLDMGIGIQGWVPKKDDWVLRGFIYAHVWQGSGWQNKYPWLAGNNDVHFTASFQAEFRIKEGDVLDEWPLVIPPGDISIGVEVSFGQFCTNDNCTEYEWGIKGKVTIIGFDVGIYVSLECPAIFAAPFFPPAIIACTSFILGSDDHLLIDQYGGNGPPFPMAAAAPDGTSDGLAHDARLASANRVTVADPTATAVDQPLNVKPTASSILVAFGWVRGAPQFVLVKPGGEVITVANAASMGATVSTTDNSIIFGIQNPTPGQWKARITNATETDDYRMMYFANKATPGVVFTAPTGVVNVNAGGDSTGAQTYRIQWTPPANAAELSMSLFYSATVLNPISPDYQYGGVIREGIDPAAGAYDWDLSHLSSGDYRIYATLQDKKGGRVSEFGTDQYVGVSTSLAPGTLRYVDQIGPPTPNAASVTYEDTEDGINVCWGVSPAHDLSEYRITYNIWDSGYFDVRTVTERVLAVVPYAENARQCMRIGGLVSGETTIEFAPNGGIAAVDASGNVSGLAAPPNYTTKATGASHYGPPPPTLAGNASGGNANLNWDTDAAATAYELFYAREAFAGPHHPEGGANQGSSPIAINAAGFGGSYTVSGLPRGYWYAFAVREFGPNPKAPPSLLSNQVWLLITDGADANGDGCPDDWEAAHQPYNGNADPDGDGLTTAQECKVGTNPHALDSDGDGAPDGVEVQEGSDPRNPFSVPVLSDEEFNAGAAQPVPARLALAEQKLTFIAYTQAPPPPMQVVPFSNLGDGSFTVSVSDNRPWLSESVRGSNIRVAVNHEGLERGIYNGTILVKADPSTTLGAQQTIQVQLVVLAGLAPGQNPDPDPDPEGQQIYLPRLGR